MALATIQQLMSKGGADAFITENPQATPWRYSHMRSTSFGIDNALMEITGSSKTGSSSVTNINREGDLITSLYVCLQLPGIDGHYKPRVAQQLIERISILVGQQCIDELTSEYLFMWDALTGQSGKMLGEMIGHNPADSTDLDDTIKRDTRARTFYVPIPFWFSSNAAGGITGNALPLISLQFHQVTLKMTLKSINDVVDVHRDWCYLLNEDGTPKLDDDYNKIYQYFPRPVVRVTQPISEIGVPGADPKNDNPTNGCGVGNTSLPALSDQDTNCYYEVGYVYLSEEERARFANLNAEILIKQTQRMSKVVTTQQSVQHRLYFNHPVTQLIWGAKRSDAKHAFDFSGRKDAKDNHVDPIANVQLKFNNHSRWNMGGGCSNNGGVPSAYFRTVVPHMAHSRIPDVGADEAVYTYNFALNPENYSAPSGSCNFSRIDNAVLEMQYDKAQGEDISHETHVFANSYNIFTVKSGMGGLSYSN